MIRWRPRRWHAASSRTSRIRFHRYTQEEDAPAVRPQEPGHGRLEPFHTYAMRQAIDEGFILDVLRNYLTYRRTAAAEAAVDEAKRKVDPRKAKAKLVRAAELHPKPRRQRARRSSWTISASTRWAGWAAEPRRWW